MWTIFPSYNLTNFENTWFFISVELILQIQYIVEPKLEEDNWAPSSEFVSSSIPSWQILTAHAHPFRGARDLAFCLKVPLESLLVWASSEGSGETAWMRRLAWTFAARIGDKYQIRDAVQLIWAKPWQICCVHANNRDADQPAHLQSDRHLCYSLPR